MLDLTKKEYVQQIAALLQREKVELQLQLEILETISELLDHYSIDFVKEVIPSLFSTNE